MTQRHSFISRRGVSPVEGSPSEDEPPLLPPLLDKIRALEEQLCFVEQARDNALVMRDAADTRRRQAGESAGRRINALVQLIRYMDSTPPPHFVEARLAEILSKDIA